MDLRNNLFRYATSELSQDAFLCWLASFALEDAKPDRALQACAHELLECFVPSLKDSPFAVMDIERQVGHIDVLLTVVSRGRTYKIIVEDKTFTSEHDNQLQRYLIQGQNTWPDCTVCGVYYKMGFQSDLSHVKAAGYQIVTREQMLNLMAKYRDQTTNPIFLDYYNWWSEYHRQTLLYQQLPLARWNSQQILGFYHFLQTGGFAADHHVWMGYGYVSNPKGGFEGLWMGLHDNQFILLDVSCSLYLQIEPQWNTERQEQTFPICLKLSLDEIKSTSVSAKTIRDALIYDSPGRYCLIDFQFQRPARMRSGKHITIGEYTRPSGETAAQFQDTLAAAINDYRSFLQKVQSLAP